MVIALKFRKFTVKIEWVPNTFFHEIIRYNGTILHLGAGVVFFFQCVNRKKCDYHFVHTLMEGGNHERKNQIRNDRCTQEQHWLYDTKRAKKKTFHSKEKVCVVSVNILKKDAQRNFLRWTKKKNSERDKVIEFE